MNNTFTTAKQYLPNVKSRFSKILPTLNFNLLEINIQEHNTIPYFNLYPKLHKLTNDASPSNLKILKGRPIITAHSWITSNPSKFLGRELNNIIEQLKDLFLENNSNFPIISSSFELLKHINNINIDSYFNYINFITFDFSSLYTNIKISDTITAIINSCKLLKLPILFTTQY